MRAFIEEGRRRNKTRSFECECLAYLQTRGTLLWGLFAGKETTLRPFMANAMADGAKIDSYELDFGACRLAYQHVDGGTLATVYDEERFALDTYPDPQGYIEFVTVYPAELLKAQGSPLGDGDPIEQALAVLLLAHCDRRTASPILTDPAFGVQLRKRLKVEGHLWGNHESDTRSHYRDNGMSDLGLIWQACVVSTERFDQYLAEETMLWLA